MAAASEGRLDLVRALLRHPLARPGEADQNGNAPLHLAAAHGHGCIARALLGAGAPAACRDVRGRTSAELAAAAGHAALAEELRAAEEEQRAEGAAGESVNLAASAAQEEHGSGDCGDRH